MQSELKGWTRLAQMLRDYDSVRIKDCKEDIDTLLVFAGLFSAVLSGFTLESYKMMEQDSSDTSLQVLLQISQQLSSFSAIPTQLNSTAPPALAQTAFSASASSIRVNSLWFSSLVCSLITASLGILVKQWLREYLAQETMSPNAQVRIRDFRYMGLVRWHVFEIASLLPLLLQFSLLLFFIGLSDFLHTVNHTVGWITTALVSAWFFIFVSTTLAPLISPQCPYKTPSLKRLSTKTQLYSASFRHHLSSLSISWKYVLPIYSLDVPIRIRRFFSTCGTVVTRLRRVVSFPHSHSVAPIDLVSEERLRNTNTAQADMLALIHTDQLLVEDSLLEHIENCLYDLGPSRTLQCFLSLFSHRLGTPVPLHDLSHISPIPYSKIRNVIHGLCRILNQLIDFSSQESVVEKFPHKLKRDPSSTSIWSTAEMHYCLVFLFRLPIPHRENQMISLSTRLLQYNHESAAAVLFAISSLDVTEVSTYPHLLATNNGMQNLVAGTSLIMNGWFPRTWPLPYPRPPSTNPILLLHSMLAITAQNLSPFPFDELQSYSPQFLGLQAQLLENIENSESWQHRSSGPPPISVFKSLKSFYEELQERAPCLVHEGLRVFLEEYNAEVNQIVRFA
ncbi:hypothetical protein C8Q75DRAFT_861615 [Abortiporus biennis]|nr:hypothetical protein C8Q75DRAFT_861615 [Abortiporus biennis]